MPPVWLTALAWAALIMVFVCAGRLGACPVPKKIM